MSSMHHPKQSRESGMVAIIVTMIMMIVISLIVLGFGQVARRNQTEALDRQLSSQAYYAAETGINDVIAKIRHAATDDPSDHYAYDSNPTNYTVCSDPASDSNFINYYHLSSQSSLGAPGTNVAYTCLLVKPNLNPVKNTVKVGSNKVVHLLPSEPIPSTTSLTFSWTSLQGDDGDPDHNVDASGCPGNSGSANVFTPSSDWENCPFGVLRFDLFNAQNPDGTEANLTEPANSLSVYAIPANNASTGIAVFGKPNVVKADCAHSVCTATLKLDASVTLNDFYVRSTAIYKDLNILSISSTDDGITFRGAGVQIDATGKAQDILRRVQVQIPTTTRLSVDAPANALSSTDAICKRFAVADDGTITPGLTNDSPLCLNN